LQLTHTIDVYTYQIDAWRSNSQGEYCSGSVSGKHIHIRTQNSNTGNSSQLTAVTYEETAGTGCDIARGTDCTNNGNASGGHRYNIGSASTTYSHITTVSNYNIAGAVD
jgi:hypothetical protein